MFFPCARSFFYLTLWREPAKIGVKAGLELILNSMAKYANNPA